MSFNYASLKNTADALLTKFGEIRTFTRTAQGVYDPITGTTSNTTSTFDKLAVALEYSDQDIADGSIERHGSIERGDRKLIAEAYGYEIGDTVVINSTSFTVVNVSITSPSDTVVVANLQIRN